MAMARRTRPRGKKTKRSKSSQARSRPQHSKRERKATKAKARRACRQEFSGSTWLLVYGEVYVIFQFDRILGVYTTKERLIENLKKLTGDDLFATDVMITIVDNYDGHR
jgi:hypothetical protein